MSTKPDNRVLYLSPTDGLHDQRWIKALIDLGFKVDFFLAPSMSPSVPIITGPLTSRPHVLDTAHPVIGLSWGYDLHDLLKENDTDWLKNLDGLIVDSAPTREIALAAGVTPDRIAVIPWGTDLDVFDSAGPRAVNSPPRILSLRAHEDLYQVDVVIDAVALLRDQGITCTLTIGNQGSLTSHLQIRCRELGVEANFIGRVAEHSLPQLFLGTDFYVSAAVTDGTSVTLLQAMAMHTPVVVSDSPGNISWLEQGDEPLGLTFTTGDSRALAETIQSALLNPKATETMALAARRVVQLKANWHDNISRLAQLITLVGNG